MSEYGDCPRCTAAIGPKAWFCTKCGYQVEKVNPLVCTVCRKPMGMWDDLCSRCGAKLEWPRTSLESLLEADALRGEVFEAPAAREPGVPKNAAEMSQPRKRWWLFWGN